MRKETNILLVNKQKQKWFYQVLKKKFIKLYLKIDALSSFVLQNASIMWILEDILLKKHDKNHLFLDEYVVSLIY